MWIREFKNKAGRPMVEFFRPTQTDDGRRSSIRLGRFQIDVCRSATGLAARRNFTASEDEQFLEWWAPRQARIDAATSRASAAARAQRTADTLPGLTRAVSAVLAGLESGALTDGAAMWTEIDRLAKSLKAAGQSRLVTTPVKVRKDKAAESVPDGQTDIEEHIAAAMARSPVMAERVA